MFTKKLEDQFSADLLNTVKGILGEAKHDKECECEKCEDEEDDEDEDENGKKKEMKEGKTGLWANIHAKRKRIKAGSGERMRKPGSEGAPTDADFKAASESVEVEEGLDKKHPIVKEYDSLKKHDIKTLRGMISRNSRVVDTSEFKTKDHAISHLLRQKHGHKKVDQAFGFNEEVEQVDNNYGIKQGDANYHNKMIKYHTKLMKMHAKSPYSGGANPYAVNKQKSEIHKKLLKTAVKKLTKEEAEQIDELSKGTLGKYIYKAADRMSTQGVTAGLKIASDENSSKNFKNITKRQKGIATAVKKLTKEELENLDELSKGTLGNYIKKAKKDVRYAGKQYVRARQDDNENEKKYADKLADKRYKGINQAVDKLTKEEQDFIDALNGADIEQIDELSKDTMLKYLSANKKSDAKAQEAGDYSKSVKRMRGTDLAVRKYTAKPGSKYVRVPAKEEVELEEGRGRPPKEGTPAWHAKQKQASDDMVALGMQLRKAKSMNKKVRFMDNKEHEVSAHHADRFEDHMAARKTSQDKAAFQKQAHKSHADFVKAVSAPVPKANKDTGEIVKYRH